MELQQDSETERPKVIQRQVTRPTAAIFSRSFTLTTVLLSYPKCALVQGEARYFININNQ